MEFSMEWNVICRVCLQEGEMFSIFEKDENGITISEKLMNCSNIKIERGVNLPENICKNCLDNLHVAYTFRNNCESSDAVLQSFVNGNVVSDLLIRTNGEIFKYKPPRDLEVKRIPKDEKDLGLVKVELFEEDKALGSEELGPEAEANEEASDENGGPVRFVFQELEEEEERVEDPLSPSPTDDHPSPSEDPFEVYNQDESNSNNTSELNMVAIADYMVVEDGRDVFTVSVQDENTSTSLIEDSENRKNDFNKTAEPQSVNSTRQPKSKTKCEKPMHICDICGNSYKQRHSLETHMRRHRNEKPFACEICGRGFVLNVELKCHMRTHTGQKPYACRYCGRRFSDFGSRIKHERTHTGERPYACETCGKAFAYSYGLSSHILTHTGEKRFECDKCGKRFAKKHHLKNHLNTHSKQETRLKKKGCISPPFLASSEDEYSSMLTVFTGDQIEESIEDYVIDVVGIKEEIDADGSMSMEGVQELPS